MQFDLKSLKSHFKNLIRKKNEKCRVLLNVDSNLVVPCIFYLNIDFKKPVIFILPDLNECIEFTSFFRNWSNFLGLDNEIISVPEIGDLKHYAAQNEIQYIRTLNEIINSNSDKNQYYSITVSSCFSSLLKPSEFKKNCIDLKVGDEIELSEVAGLLIDLDYDNEYETTSYCEFSKRGGILDVFSPVHDKPARIEFWGNEIDSIRLYSPITQKTVERVDSYQIVGRDVVGGSDAKGSFLEYLPNKPQKVFIFPEKCRQTLGFYSDERITERFENTISENLLDDFIILNSVESAFFNEGITCEIEPVNLDKTKELSSEIDFSSRMIEIQLRTQQLINYIDSGYKINLLARSLRGSEYLSNWCQDNGIDPKEILIEQSDIPKGFVMAYNKTVFFTEKEVLCLPQKKSLQKIVPAVKKEVEYVQGEKYSDFNLGDYVVHITHGIGIFQGIKEIEVSGTLKEVIEIEYDDEVKLYVPIWQANLVSRYVGSKKNAPKLNKIGGSRWTKTKASALRGARDMAVDMLRMQAFRINDKGFRYDIDEKEQEYFEESFPFTETIDQVKANNEIKRDMLDVKPMDRLVCGDVGYGKTEVAIRAAFRAVNSGKQVAILVPTTILAQQHYFTFIERFAEYPFIIDMLSRFKTPTQQKETLIRLSEGKVDIIIGTHRLIQRDVSFSNLGLIIIDEEQKFGVEHKDRLKKIRVNVDILTMTATPIPRTLYLAMSGIRNFSTIMTPPVDRLPVQTVVSKFDDELIKGAVYREVRRGGQVFFLHNRVKTIEKRFDHLRKIMPDIKFEAAHGQMDETELEDIMARFISGEINVLISTTIIESGVDIPNANTIIIERADRFGLAELYQLRGRVGRWTRQAYAYLLLPEHNIMTGKAKERLAAIRHYTQLGVGFRLAIKDLEIRGAGNILGAQQSGHINAIGFDLYCQLLKQTVNSLKGNEDIEFIPNVDISFDFVEFGLCKNEDKINAFLPSKYIDSEILRIDFYRRISMAASLNEVLSLREEMIDRFGKIPEEAENFIKVMKLRLKIGLAGYTSVSISNDHLFAEGLKRGLLMVDGKIPRLYKRNPFERLNEIENILKGIEV